jgi:hypothetical protein
MGLPARQWRLRDACRLSVSTTSWRYGLRRICRLVTGRSNRPRSTWPNETRLALLAVTHRYNRIPCLWLGQFQIAESVRPVAGITMLGGWAQIFHSGELCRPEDRPIVNSGKLPGSFMASCLYKRHVDHFGQTHAGRVFPVMLLSAGGDSSFGFDKQARSGVSLGIAGVGASQAGGTGSARWLTDSVRVDSLRAISEACPSDVMGLHGGWGGHCGCGGVDGRRCWCGCK